MFYWIILQRFIDVSGEPNLSIFKVDVFYNLLHIPRRKQYSDNLFRLVLYWLMLVARFLLMFSLIGPFNKVFGHVPAVLQKHGSVLFGHRTSYVFGSTVSSAVSISKTSRCVQLLCLTWSAGVSVLQASGSDNTGNRYRCLFRSIKGRDP